MTDLTLIDYERAHAAFVTRLETAGDALESVFLFGSMARGEAIPGYSDLDYWVFLAAGVLNDRKRFLAVLHLLVTASQAVAAEAIPVYNVCCYYEHERLAQIPAMLYANLQSDNDSRIVLGTDVRSQMAINPVSITVNQASAFYALRQQVYHPLAAFLDRQSLNAAERKQIFYGLQYAKYIPEAACAALGIWPGEFDARTHLTAALPALDMGILSEARLFCAHDGPDGDIAATLALLRRFLQFVETLHELVFQAALDHG